MMLFAVHISDGALQPAWLLCGLALAGVLLFVGIIRVKDDEVPRVALLTAAFFVASLIHVRVGPTSVHLLLNGLVGIVLGWRAPLAIACGLLLQAWLVQHGGLTTLGVNTLVMSVPALASWSLFRLLHRPCFIERGVPRSLLVMLSVFVGIETVTFATALFVHNTRLDSDSFIYAPALDVMCGPVALGAACLAALAAALVERGTRSAPEFALGLLLGELTVVATVGLNCAVLILGGEQRWSLLPVALLLAHLPLAVIEGLIVGFTLGFLAKVKPELLRSAVPLNPSATCLVAPVAAKLEGDVAVSPES